MSDSPPPQAIQEDPGFIPPGLPADSCVSYRPDSTNPAFAGAQTLSTSEPPTAEESGINPPETLPGRTEEKSTGESQENLLALHEQGFLLQAAEGDSPAAAQAQYPSGVPAFRLGRLLGQGGNGEVYEALQHSLHRQVAIKRIQKSLASAPMYSPRYRAALRAFRQEAITTANLEHPNIVPIHDLGQDEDGRPAIVMKIVRGKPWSEIILADASMPASDFYAKHLPILIQVAQATAFAHSRQIIHRDLKPSQIMIGEFGEVQVMDWGLAVYYPDSKSPHPPITPSEFLGLLTTASNPAGTPAFMAPEQTDSNLDRIGPWTDIFLLGGILYFLAVKSPPYLESDSRKVFVRARACNFDPPRARAPRQEIPPELEALIMASMSPNPKDRPESAQEFIRRVRDYLTGAGRRRKSEAACQEAREQFAREPKSYAVFNECRTTLTRAERLWPENPEIAPLRAQWAEAYARHALGMEDLAVARLAAEELPEGAPRQGLLREVSSAQRLRKHREKQRRAAFAAIALFLLILVAGGFRYAHDQKNARSRAEKARQEALHLKKMAQTAQRTAEQARQQAELEQYFSAISASNVHMRSGGLRAVKSTLFHFCPEWPRNLEWGLLMAQLHRDQMILETGGAGQELMDARFSPDGSKILTANRSGILSLWDASTGRKIYKKKAHPKAVWCAVFSPDGQRILTNSLDQTAAILDAATGETLFNLAGHTNILRGGTFSPKGDRAATTSRDRTVRLWDVRSGALERIFTMPNSVYDVDWSPDGRRLGIAMLSRAACIFDIETSKTLISLLGHEANVLSIRFDSEGKRIATAGTDRKVRVFDASNGKLLVAMDSPEAILHCVAFSPDGSRLASSNDSGICRIYDSKNGNVLDTLYGASKMYKVSFSPDSKKLATASDKETRVWSIEGLAQSLQKASRQDAPSKGAPSAAIQVMSMPFDRYEFWRERDKTWSQVPGGRSWFRDGAEFFAVDSYYSVPSPTGGGRIEMDYNTLKTCAWRNGDLAPCAVLRQKDAYCAQYSPDGRLAAIGTQYGEVFLWDTASTWSLKASWRYPKRDTAVYSLAFHPKKELLLAGMVDGAILGFNLPDLKERFKIKGHEKSISCLNFHPDGVLFASGSSDTSIRIWDSRSALLAHTLQGHEDVILSAQFSPDGQRLLSSSNDLTIRLWAWQQERELFSPYIYPKGAQVLNAALSADGRRILIPTQDGRLLSISAFPWKTDEYPAPGAPLEKRIELFKRRLRLHKDITIEDIAWSF